VAAPVRGGASAWRRQCGAAPVRGGASARRRRQCVAAPVRGGASAWRRQCVVAFLMFYNLALDPTESLYLGRTRGLTGWLIIVGVVSGGMSGVALGGGPGAARRWWRRRWWRWLPPRAAKCHVGKATRREAEMSFLR
jgi:hypothetical protein